MSITGAVIIAFVMIVRLFLKKLPRKYSYILWIIPAIRLLIPFSVAAPVSVFNFIHIPEPHAVISDSGEVNEPPALTDDIFTEPITDAVIGEVTDDGYLDSVPDGWYTGESVPQITGPVFTYDVITNPPLATDPIAAPEVTDAPDADMPAAPVVSEVNTALTLWRAACAVWATGVIAMLCYLAYSFAATKRAVEHSYKIGEGLYSNGYIDTPFVFGYIKPRIYVPLGLDDKEFAYVVAHEKTHIKRCDHIIKAAASLILCVHWFNPFAWLAFKLMTVDMELSCDERAINTYDLDVRKDYARALLNMSVVSKKVPFHGMLSFGESSIKSRIKGILRMKKPAAWACVLAVAVTITAAVCLLTNAEQTPPDKVGEDTTDSVETTEPADTDEPVTDEPVTDEPITTDDPVTTDPPSVDGETEHLFEDKLKDYTTADIRIGVTVPAMWSFESDVATQNGEKCFEFVSAWPYALGLDTESIKTAGGYEGVTTVEEKTGEPGEAYNYLYHGKTSIGDYFECVVLRNGYYVHLRLDGDTADSVVLNTVLESVKIYLGNALGDTSMLSHSKGNLVVDVIGLDVQVCEGIERLMKEDAEYVSSRIVSSIEFRNKYINITTNNIILSSFYYIQIINIF